MMKRAYLKKLRALLLFLAFPFAYPPFSSHKEVGHGASTHIEALQQFITGIEEENYLLVREVTRWPSYKCGGLLLFITKKEDIETFLDDHGYENSQLKMPDLLAIQDNSKSKKYHFLLHNLAETLKHANLTSIDRNTYHVNYKMNKIIPHLDGSFSISNQLNENENKIILKKIKQRWYVYNFTCFAL